MLVSRKRPEPDVRSDHNGDGVSLAGWSIYRAGERASEIDINDPDASKQLLVSEVELAFTLVFWGIGSASLARSNVINRAEAEPIRAAYNQSARAAGKIANDSQNLTGQSLKAAAIRCHDIRHQARLTARETMSQWMSRAAIKLRDFWEYGNEDGPTFNFLMQKANAKGYYGDDAYKYIMSGSARTNAAVNSVTK